MRFSKQFKRAFLSVVAALVFATMLVADLKPVEAGTTPITFSQSGGTSQKYSRDPSFSLEKDSSWITIKTSSPSDFTISASSNSTGKGRIGYVYVKRQGSVVTTYKIIQQGSTNLSVGPAKGSTSTYSKNSNQTVTTSCSWITLYKPNAYNVRMDYAANTTGSTRTGYVYVKEGTTTFTTYKITQSATVTVTYNKNGGSGSNFTRSLAVGSVYGKVDNPTRTGYNFSGWFTATSGGNQVVETTKVTNTSNHTLYARWSQKSYTVSFNSQGGTSVSAKTVYYDGTYGSLTNSAKTGYTFAGWFTAASGGTQVTSSTKVTITANQTLYAHWTPNNYTVSFNSQGGSSVSSKTVTFNSTYGTLSNPTKTGYTFAGWYTAASGGTKITSSSTVTTAGNHTLYAHWTGNTYTVSFNSQGGSSVSSKTVTYGSSYGTLSNPTKTGYTFAGWFTAASSGSQKTASATVSTAGNHTLYAHWTPCTYTVSFNANGGSAVTAKTVTYGSAYGTLTNSTRTGYTFAGWYTAASGGTQVTSGTTVTTAGNHTLYAHWTANKYTVSFDSQGGSSISAKTVTYGSAYGTLSNPTRTGYTFAGWYTAASGGSQRTATTTVATAANHTLYAHWTPNKFTVSFNSNGGSSVSSMTVTYGSAYGTLPIPTKTGYSLAGWYTAASGGSQVTASSPVTTASNHTLYGRWTANKYTVTFDSQGGSAVSAITVTYDSTYGTLASPTRTGYSFDGWYTAKSGGTRIYSTSKVTTAAYHTLYAHWTPITVTVTYDKNDGSGETSTRKIAYDSAYGKVGDPTRTGYDFRGWYLTKTYESQVTETTKMLKTVNHTLYAKWSPKSYTVSFNSQGGSTVSSMTVYYDFLYGTLPTPTKENYTFDGWYTATTGGTKITPGTLVTLTANQTLYAHWTGIKVTVTYNKDGGDGDNFTRKIAYGSNYGKVETPTRTGYNFLGWYYDTTYYKQVTETTVMDKTDDHTLYAKWEVKELTVSFDSQGGSSIAPKTVKYSYCYGDLETPKKVGYVFDGWFTKATGGIKVDKNTQITFTTDQTLYAHWTDAVTAGCTHSEYTELVITQGDCINPGLKVRTCKKCNTSWEVVVRPRGKHEYDINYNSRLNVLCKHCGESKHIGDMSLDELSLSWEVEKRGYSVKFEYRDRDTKKEILTKLIYAIREREDPEGTYAKDVEAYVNKLFGGKEEERIYDTIGDELWNIVDLGKSSADILDLIGQLNSIGKVGECDLSKYSKICGKVCLLLALTNPDTPLDVKGAKIIGEFLPITGPILEGVCEAGHVAIFVARTGVAKGIGSVKMYEAVEAVSSKRYDSLTVPLWWLDAYKDELKEEMRKKDYGLDDETIDMIYQVAVQEAIEREIGSFISMTRKN